MNKTYKIINFRLPEKVVKDVKRQAKKEGLSMTQFLMGHLGWKKIGFNWVQNDAR